jgi:hypothetical protein
MFHVKPNRTDSAVVVVICPLKHCPWANPRVAGPDQQDCGRWTKPSSSDLRFARCPG